MKSMLLRVSLLSMVAWAFSPASPLTAAGATEVVVASCDRFGTLQFICGPSGAEDIVRVEGTPWLIASGLAEPGAPGRLHLIDSASKRWEVAFPSRAVSAAPDVRRFPDCKNPPDEAVFSAHGLAIRTTGAGRQSLLVVNHGGREAIEFFDVSSRGAKPVLTWIGCVVMPADISVNSVVQLPDGGFLATKFYAPSEGGINKIFSGAVTGGVLEWKPGRAVVEIPGTGVSGANGIEISHRGRVIYVAAWGTHDIVRFDRRGATLRKDVKALDFAADNLRWAPDNKLLAAGQKIKISAGNAPELQGWSVARVMPDTLAVTPVYNADTSVPMQGISVALEVDGVLWVGPYRGDRIGYMPVPR